MSRFAVWRALLGVCAVAALLTFGVVGGIIGVASFPIAYATVGRTRNVLSVVPAGLLATVLGAWIGFEMLTALQSWLPFLNNLGGGWFLIFLSFPIIAMFGACAWIAARERRKIGTGQASLA